MRLNRILIFLILFLLAALTVAVAAGCFLGLIPYQAVRDHIAAFYSRISASPEVKPKSSLEEEVELLLSELNKEKEWLKEKEERLRRWEEELTKREEELKESIGQQKEEGSPDASRALSWFQAMSPRRAAEILSEVQVDYAAFVLLELDDQTAAKILEAMDPKLAAQVSEILLKERR